MDIIIACAVAACSNDLAAGDRDVSCADSVAVDVTVCARNCAAGDIQNTVAGDGDIFIGDINTIAGVDFVSVVAIGPRDRVLAYQFNGKAGFTVDGGRSVVKKCTGTLGNRRAIQGQGAAVPFDVVVFRSRVRGRYCTVRSCHGVGRGGLRARQLHAAHVDVGVVRLSRTGCGDGEINRLECAGIVGFLIAVVLLAEYVQGIAALRKTGWNGNFQATIGAARLCHPSVIQHLAIGFVRDNG